MKSTVAFVHSFSIKTWTTSPTFGFQFMSSKTSLKGFFSAWFSDTGVGETGSAILNSTGCCFTRLGSALVMIMPSKVDPRASISERVRGGSTETGSEPLFDACKWGLCFFEDEDDSCSCDEDPAHIVFGPVNGKVNGIDGKSEVAPPAADFGTRTGGAREEEDGLQMLELGGFEGTVLGTRARRFLNQT